jgi:hypothetical protein
VVAVVAVAAVAAELGVGAVAAGVAAAAAQAGGGAAGAKFHDLADERKNLTNCRAGISAHKSAMIFRVADRH